MRQYVWVLKHYISGSPLVSRTHDISNHVLQRIIDSPSGDHWVIRYDAYWFLAEFIEDVVCNTNLKYRDERDHFDRNLKA